MRTCKKCAVEKNEVQFRLFGRGRKKVCKACEGLDQGEAVIAARSSGHAKPEPAPKPATLKGALEIPSGLGFRASIEDDLLFLEQERPDDGDPGMAYTHTLTLNRVEAQRFIDWISRLVEPEAAA